MSEIIFLALALIGGIFFIGFMIGLSIGRASAGSQTEASSSPEKKFDSPMVQTAGSQSDHSSSLEKKLDSLIAQFEELRRSLVSRLDERQIAVVKENPARSETDFSWEEEVGEVPSAALSQTAWTKSENSVIAPPLSSPNVSPVLATPSESIPTNETPTNETRDATLKPEGERPFLESETVSASSSLQPQQEETPSPADEIQADTAFAIGTETNSLVDQPEKTEEQTTIYRQEEEKVVDTAAPKEPAPPAEERDAVLVGLGKKIDALSKFLGLGNIWVLVGVAILLLGVTFLVRLAIDSGVLTPPLRLALSSLVGVALLALGWSLRAKRRDLALILQGGGIGALYLTVVAAVQLYDLLPSVAAFVVLVLLVGFSTFLAIVQNSRIMAHVANVAGFLAPILISTGSGNYIALFTYYVMLNLGLVGVSYYRHWRSLHLTGFLFTVAIGGLWGAHSYVPSMFVPIEIFLWVFFALFTYLALAGSTVFRTSGLLVFKDDTPEGVVDIPLTLGTPLVFFFYQIAVVQEKPFVLAFTTLIMGALYLGIARLLWTRRVLSAPLSGNGTAEHADSDKQKEAQDAFDSSALPLAALTGLGRKVYALQAEIYLTFSIVALNLALPLALLDLDIPDVRLRLLGLVWALEGAGLYWIGRRHALGLFRIFGILGFLLAALFQLIALTDGSVATSYGALAVVMVFHFLSAASFASVALACRCFSLPNDPPSNRDFQFVFLTLGVLWLYMSWFAEAWTFTWTGEIILVGTMIVAAICLLVSRRLGWEELRFAVLLSYPPALVLLLLSLPALLSALTGSVSFYSAYFWPPYPDLLSCCIPSLALLSFALFEGVLLFLHKDRTSRIDQLRLTVLPTLLVTPLILLTTYGVAFNLDTIPTALHPLCDLLVAVLWPVLTLLAWTHFSPARRPSAGRLRLWGGDPVALLLLLWICAHLFERGIALLPVYLPLFNTVEAGLLASLFALYRWSRSFDTLPEKEKLRRFLRPEFGYGVLLLVLTISLARACSFWTDMSFSFSGALRAPVFQATLALLWGVAGIAAMLYGHRNHNRLLWLAGTSLMLADIAKLFFIDLTRMETGWRIVAFMGVGALLILIGYFAPLPPVETKKGEKKKADTEKEDLVSSQDSDIGRNTREDSAL